VKEKNFNATPMDVSLWVWNNSQEPEVREHCYEVVALLARAGSKLDRDHWRLPGSQESEMLKQIEADSRMQAALRGEPVNPVA
jgi:hypothetical protein